MDWYLKVLKNYVGFRGRARRKEYWMFILVNIIFTFVLGLLDKMLGWQRAGGEGILAEIGQPEQRSECNAAHATHERALLCFHAIREHAFVPSKVELFVAACVVGLLEYGYVVGSAFVQVSIFIGIHRVDF